MRSRSSACHRAPALSQRPRLLAAYRPTGIPLQFSITLTSFWCLAAKDTEVMQIRMVPFRRNLSRGALDMTLDNSMVLCECYRVKLTTSL